MCCILRMVYFLLNLLSIPHMDRTFIRSWKFSILTNFEMHSIPDEVGTPSAPALVADSLTATSLSLEWEIPPRLNQFTKGRPYITKSYLVQWRYEEVVGDWKFCRNQSMGDNSTVRVDNLQPYTKYRVRTEPTSDVRTTRWLCISTVFFLQFRVALILSPNHEKELFSEQSVIISTLPMGIPLSEPAIVRAVAVDHTRISVSWEPGPFPNGPILSYVLQIKDLTPDGYFALKVLINIFFLIFFFLFAYMAKLFFYVYIYTAQVTRRRLVIRWLMYDYARFRFRTLMRTCLLFFRCQLVTSLRLKTESPFRLKKQSHT